MTELREKTVMMHARNKEQCCQEKLVCCGAIV